MHENFVDYGKELLNANESQRNKIEFLQRQRIKRDHYLSDLQENLVLNKQTLRQYNEFGSNSAAVASLNREAQLLIRRLKDYYDEYQSINASLLMEQQMRLSDRQLYEERLVEFENKMVDLRKYLHDKEESFSSVVARLRRYQDLAQPTIEQKLHTFKKEIGERHVHQFIAELIKEKNKYQRQCENMRKHYYAFNQIKNVLINRDAEAAEMIETFEKEYQAKISNIANPKANGNKEQHSKSRTINPNHDLIRLLKKQKLNNQLLQDALNDAIDKNQELALANDLFRKNIQQLQRKCHLLRAENTIFALRLAEYDHHYCRVATHCKKYYEQGEIQGLRYITEQRLKQYAKSIEKYFESEDLNKVFNEKMKQEVQKWSRHIMQAQGIKKSNQHAGLFIKSSSTPKLLISFQLDDGEQCNMIIDEF